MLALLRSIRGWVASAFLSRVTGPGSLAQMSGQSILWCEAALGFWWRPCLAESCRPVEGPADPSWVGGREALWAWAMWQVSGAPPGWENRGCGQCEALALLQKAVVCLVIMDVWSLCGSRNKKAVGRATLASLSTGVCCAFLCSFIFLLVNEKVNPRHHTSAVGTTVCIFKREEFPC